MLQNKKRNGYVTLALAAASLLVIGHSFAQTQTGGDRIEKELEAMERENPLIDPVRGAAAETVPSLRVATDPRVVGTTPNDKKPALRREGEFIISRRGRLVRSGDGASMVFVFDADEKDSPDPPMVIMPCQMLQNMEDLVRERGDSIAFKLSGQVYTYRGANYLLPTMMKLAVDKGNNGER